MTGQIPHTSRLGQALTVFAILAIGCLSVSAVVQPAYGAGSPSSPSAAESGRSPQGAAAEDAEASLAAPESGLPEIEVEVVGKREGLLSISPTPGEQVVEVTSAEIADSGAATVLEAIDLTPSVFVRHQGARYESRLSIRGQTPRLVLLDGIPIAREGTSGPGGGAGGAEAGFAGRILYTMPAELIERIDVIRSANTIIYGPASSAGAVVNIVTRDPEIGSKVAATLEHGSFDRVRELADARVNDGRLGFYVLGGSEYSGSHLPLGEKRFQDRFGKVFHNYPDGSRLLIEFFSLDGRRTLDLSQDFTIVPPRYWRIDPWREQFANAVYSKALSDEATLDLVFYQRSRDFTTNLYTDESFSTVRMDWLESQDDKGVDLRYSVRRDDGRMTRFGLQWSDLTSDALQTQYVGGSGPLRKPKVSDVSRDRTTRSAFVSHALPLRANLRASFGARCDDVDEFSPDTTFSAGLEANVSAQTTWYLSFGTGAEHPDPTAGDVEKNIVPSAAASVSAETGWTVRPDESRSWTLALFWAKTRDARVLYNDPPGEIGPLAFLSKAEDLSVSGAEIMYSQRVSDRLSWFANYGHLREHVTNDNTPAIPGPDYPFAPEPPRSIAAAGVRAELGATRVALSAKYASDHFEQNRLMQSAAPVGGYLVYDLKLNRPIGRGQLSLAVENLLDAGYETMPAFPRPGRNYLVSYRTSF